MRRVLLLSLLALAAACSSPATREAAPAPSPEPTARATATAATPSARPSPTWVLGASPLPVGPDGSGLAGDTPPSLRDRRLPTRDLLPPPPGGHWASAVLPVDAAVRARMGATWSPACPVGLADLRLLHLAFRGFDGRAHTGELVVAASVADDVVQVFHALWDAGFPVEEMRLPTTADLAAAPTGDGNDTVGYVCRAARGQTRWSAHARGLAIDLDPFQNPQLRRGRVLPELARAYTRRGDVRPGMVLPGSVAVRAFAAAGWTWGGTWSSSKDWMHFSATGD